MTPLHSILVLLAAFLAVFAESAFTGLRHWLGAQIDLLPALVVYAALATDLGTTVAASVLGGLLFDSLSANPLGITILPLFLVGFVIYTQRDLILRDQLFAQYVLGLAASAITPALTVLLLLTTGKNPLLGWGSLWQWTVMGVAGAVAVPLWFELFGLFDRALSYRHHPETSFRPDREIRRGR